MRLRDQLKNTVIKGLDSITIVWEERLIGIILRVWMVTWVAPKNSVYLDLLTQSVLALSSGPANGHRFHNQAVDEW